MHCSRLLRSTGVDPVAYRCLLQALQQCGVAHKEVLPDASPAALNHGPATAFLPLFTTKFHFHQHQLTTLGDALVDRYLSAALLQYCTRRGAVLTTNAAGEVNAVLHNHFTLRLFAKELQFEAMAMSPEQQRGATPDGVEAAASSLDFLEAERASMRRQDVAGTSHQITLLPCGQSPLGWKFSQFVGAVQQTFGNEAATRVLEHVYQLRDEPNLPRRASQLLLRVLEHFPATSVAEAVLAAQGLAVHYTAKSRILPGDVQEEGTTSRGNGGQTASSQGTEAETSASTSASDTHNTQERAEEMSVVTGFDATRAPQCDVTLERLIGGTTRSSGLAQGPGLVDSVDMWRKRTAELAARGLEPATESGDLLRSPASTSATDGWLTAQERATYERGPAFAGWVDFRAFTSYADVYGPSQPENGRIVRRRKFKKEVRDPRFYDSLSDARNGVPFDTNGETLPDYLDAFARPHRRLFEVTMSVGGSGEMKLVGRAIAPRYTTARESAARAFLGGALRDVLALESGNVDGAQEVPSE